MKILRPLYYVMRRREKKGVVKGEGFKRLREGLRGILRG